MRPLPPPDQRANPAEVLRASRWRREFLEHNRGTRGEAEARGLLDAEWRYLGPLLTKQGRAGSPARVLDLACGSGAATVAWLERAGHVVGVDFDAELLVIARQRCECVAPGASSWSCGDATRLPLRANSFDLVFCNSLLEHAVDWRAVLREMARVLRRGGVAVVYTTNRHCPFQQEINHFPFYSWLPDAVKRPVLRWIMAYRRDLVNYTDFPAINWFTFPAMRRAFREVGLEPHDRIDLTPKSGVGRLRGAAVRAMHRWPPGKAFYYLYATSMGLYGVKA